MRRTSDRLLSFKARAGEKTARTRLQKRFSWAQNRRSKRKIVMIRGSETEAEKSQHGWGCIVC